MKKTVPRPTELNASFHGYDTNNPIYVTCLTSSQKQVWSKLKITTEIPGIVFHTAVKLGRFMVVFGESHTHLYVNSV